MTVEEDKLKASEASVETPKQDQPPAAPASQEPPPKEKESTIAQQYEKLIEDDEPTKAPEQEPSAPTQEKLFADRYKTADELENSTKELLKTLTIPETSLIKRQLEQARKDGKWDDIEILNKELQAEFTKRNASPAKPSSDAASSPDNKGTDKSTPLSDTERAARDEELKEVYGNKLLEGLASSDIHEDFKIAGIEFPKSKEELRELREANPWLYKELMREIARLDQEIVADIHERVELYNGVPPAMEQAKKDGADFIAKVNKDWRLKLTDEDIAKHVEAALKADDVFFTEDKKGAKYPRKEAVQNYFLLKVLPAILPQAILNAEAEGRTTHAAKLKEMKEAVIDTASTSSSQKSSKTSVSPKIDYTDPNQVEQLSPKQRAEKIRELAEAD